MKSQRSVWYRHRRASNDKVRVYLVETTINSKHYGRRLQSNMDGILLDPDWDDMGYMGIKRPGSLLPKVQRSVSSFACSWVAAVVFKIAIRQVCT